MSWILLLHYLQLCSSLSQVGPSPLLKGNAQCANPVWRISATSRSPPTTLSLSMFCFVFRVADMSPSGGCWLYVNRMVFASQMLCRYLGSSLWFPGPCFSGVGFVVFFGPCGACGSAVLFGPMWGVWFCCFIWPHVGRLVLVAVGVLNPYS